jgi:hypothetical protein
VIIIIIIIIIIITGKDTISFMHVIYTYIPETNHIIIIIINWKWVDTRWQWSVYICTDYEVWLLLI